ncbi:MAG: NADH-quinone oxidoreductase subunit N [Anaerolineales bacterium]
MVELPTFADLNVFAALPMIMLAVGGALLLVADRFIKNKFYTATYALVGVLVSLVLALIQAGEVFDIGDPGLAFMDMFVADKFTYVVNVVVLTAAAIGILASYDYLERTNLDRGEYYILLIYTAVGAMLMGSSSNLVMIFIALELLSIPLYVLSGIRRPAEESEESAMKYFLLGAFSSAFFVYGIGLIFGATGTMDLRAVWEAANTITAEDATAEFLLLMGSGMLLVGLGFKVAAVPFHMWTPDVYQGAPTPVTAYMSVVAKVGGFAALLRVMITGLSVSLEGGNTALWLDTVQVVAVATLVLGNFVAIVQTDLKRLLAYSSIAHAGYILIAVASGAVQGFGDAAAEAALIYMVAYTFTNIGAFAVVIALENDDMSGTKMSDIKGLANRYPWHAMAMAVFMFSLTGVPLTAGFIGKFFVFKAALDADLTLLAVIGVLTSVVSAFYYVRVIVYMYFEPEENEITVDRKPMLNSALAITTVGTFVLGVLPFIVADLVQGATIALVP